MQKDEGRERDRRGRAERGTQGLRREDDVEVEDGGWKRGRGGD